MCLATNSQVVISTQVFMNPGICPLHSFPMRHTCARTEAATSYMIACLSRDNWKQSEAFQHTTGVAVVSNIMPWSYHDIAVNRFLSILWTVKISIANSLSQGLCHSNLQPVNSFIYSKNLQNAHNLIGKLITANFMEHSTVDNINSDHV